MIEQYLNNPAAIWTVFFLTAAATGAALDGLGRMVWRFIDAGRSWIITVPDVVGAKATIQRKRLNRGQLTRKRGDENETVILSGDCAYPTNRGPLHLISPYGASLVAPTLDEPGVEGKSGKKIKAEASLWQRLRIWDCLTYWRATRENDMEDLYAAQREKEPWQMKALGLVAVLACVLIAALGFVLWKAWPLIEKAAG